MTKESNPPSFYPALFHAADRAASRYQRQHLWLMKGILSFGFATSIAGTVLSDVDSIINVVAFLGLLLTLSAQAAWKPSQHWYAARALAESVKSLTWRFVMRGEPFSTNDDEPQVLRTFLDSLRSSTESVRELRLSITGDTQKFTHTLLEKRQVGFSERFETYVRDRLEVQLSWYVDKARYHARQSSLFTALLIGLASAGLLFSLWQFRTDAGLELSPPIASLGTAALSYLNVRQHSVLSRSYRLTAHELSLIISSAPLTDESSWGEFVDSAEGAISREHTMWSASRGFSPPRHRDGR